MIRCNICPNNCLIEHNTICGRSLIDENTIKTTAVTIDPIEKKPLYHYKPGSQTLSVGTLGCNLKCLNCQNHPIAQPEDASSVPIRTFSPKSLVDIALDKNIKSISWTYNEPTIHPEWIINTAKIAQKYDIKTILVTNAYTSQKTLNKLVKYVDAVNIDLKSMNDEFYNEICSGKLEHVLNSIEFYYKSNIHTEITTLLIPGYNDDLKSINSVVDYIKRISNDIILHFSAFYPQYKLIDVPPTSEDTILHAFQIAKKNGLKYVYPGNTNPSCEDNTYCEKCGEILIERDYYNVKNHIINNLCPKCGEKTDFIKK